MKIKNKKVDNNNLKKVEKYVINFCYWNSYKLLSENEKKIMEKLLKKYDK